MENDDAAGERSLLVLPGSKEPPQSAMAVSSLPQTVHSMGGSQAGPDRKPLLRASWRPVAPGGRRIPQELDDD